MDVNIIRTRLSEYENEYTRFMIIDRFPSYDLQTKTVSLNTADAQGFEVAAAAYYHPDECRHTLVVSTNLLLSKHLVFHEFTHILDSEMYAKGDKLIYVGLSAYTEYHASQIELAQLLGASNISTIPSFSMDNVVSTFSGDKTVGDYLKAKYQHAIDLFSRASFPDSLETLKTAIGVLCNYFGLRSICELYSTDFEEDVQNEVFLKYITSFDFSALNRVLHGWLTEKQVYDSCTLYTTILLKLISQYKLHF